MSVDRTRPAAAGSASDPNDVDAVARLVGELWGIEVVARRLSGEKDVNHRLTDAAGTKRLIKIYSPETDPEVVAMQTAALDHAGRRDPGLPIQRVIPTLAGEVCPRLVAADGATRTLRMVSYLDGVSLDRSTASPGQRRAVGAAAARLQAALADFRHPRLDHPLIWDMKRAAELRPHLAFFAGAERERLAAILDLFETRILPDLPRLPSQLVHNDFNGDNLLVAEDDPERVAGIIDFDDAVAAPRLFDLAVACAYQIRDADDPVAAIGDCLDGYLGGATLSTLERELLPAAILTRMAMRLIVPEWRGAQLPDNHAYVTRNSDLVRRQLARFGAGSIAEIAARLSTRLSRPRTPAVTTAPVMHNAFDPTAASSLSERDRRLVERRAALLGPAYRLFYKEPVHVVRAEGVRLWDADGAEYLDCYNNVPSVGHCHPRVVAAIAAQAARLNTHTRYLDAGILDYSERLLATFPAEIGRVMYTCTGSEAVDLALRIAHGHTGGTGVIVTENAYHGTTAAAAAISPSLGAGVPLGAHVVTVPAPDRYRRGDGVDVGAALAADVARAIAFLERHGIRFSAFVADGIFSTDGVLPDPAGFLAPVVEVVHRAGGVYVADEVQPGFGRTGRTMWGFQRHGIVPDLVVMGKPMGNGLPIAAVAMKPEVVERFGAEARYFNTFGANHVSIAAAAAVLDVIAEEALMDNAAAVGDRLVAGLRGLAERRPSIGDVRGAGLFVGVEFVVDRASRTPDPARAQAVVDALRARRILISASGSHGQVLKIRPPLPFSAADADTFLAALDEVLDALDREG